jgi:hypothetical protein
MPHFLIHIFQSIRVCVFGSPLFITAETMEPSAACRIVMFLC